MRNVTLQQQQQQQQQHNEEIWNMKAGNDLFSSTAEALNYLPYISIGVVPLHICNIILIVVCRKLHQNVYTILLNLSISDIVYIAW